MNIKTILTVLTLSLCGLFVFTSPVYSAQKLLVELDALDPQVSSSLGNEEMLYVRVRYESSIPLRFQALAEHEGSVLEVGAIKNPAPLHAPGEGEALVWVGYTNPTHIDAVRVTVFTEEWRELYQLTAEADVIWQGVASESPREPAEWVTTMLRAEQRKMDYVYDPSPSKYGSLYDFTFFVSLASIPIYILLQLHMLWRYRYRWRELAVIPIFPYAILFFYVVAGLNIETSLQVTFLFRYTPLALLYLIALWLAKRFWQKKLPPPKLYKPPKP
jgi:hypothetical protein